MLDFAIFAVTFVIVLLVAVIYLYPTSRKATTVPGLDATNTETGNLPDIERAGSLHEFLVDLHGQYGCIASFWMGQQIVVSVASPDLFKEHQGVFDRPGELYKLFQPLYGSQSITLTNKGEGRARRNTYAKAFTQDALRNTYSLFNKVSRDLGEKWASLGKDEHIPLTQHMVALAFKVLMLSLLGDFFQDDQKLLQYRKNFDICWSITEESLAEEGFPSEGSPQLKRFDQAKAGMHSTLRELIKQRKSKSTSSQKFVDVVLQSGASEETILDDLVTYTAGSVHTTANMLSWAMYFLATHKDYQDKLVKEIQTVLGTTDVSEDNIDKLRYLRQVIDETLRCSVVSPWTARVQDFDSELKGHRIPKDTPVIHATGVVLKDETYWPEPNVFDPDRFSAENVKGRSPLTFPPFGFAGKRSCPGSKLAYMEVSCVLVALLRRFRVRMVEGQVVKPVYGLVTRPEDEIWITIDKRK